MTPERRDEIRGWLAALGEASALAIRASVAARVDRGVLRELRLSLRTLDATAETDVWFSPLVAVRTASEIVFDGPVLDELRALATGSAWLSVARTIVARAHGDGSALLALEEQLVYLALAEAPLEQADELLAGALLTMSEDPARAPEIAAWALHSIPRLPASLRGRAPAWSLGWAAIAHTGYAIELGETPVAGIMLPPVPNVALAVQRAGTMLRIGGAETGARITAPDTHPRVLVVNTIAGAQVVSMGANGVVEVPVAAGELTVTNLRGERWRIDEYVRHSSLAVAPERGYWILVDGPDLELSPRRGALARELGAALARAGFSLITLGGRGVAEAVTRACWDVLAHQGFSSGSYRITHVLSADLAPGIQAPGGVVVVDDPVRVARERADAVVTIGSSASRAQVAPETPPHPIVFCDLECQEPISGDLTDSATRCEAAVAWLVTQLALAPESTEPGFAELVSRAACLLDLTDAGHYDAQLTELRRQVPGSLAAGRYIADTRRPSHRLIGYLSWRVALHAGTAVEPEISEIVLALHNEVDAVQARRDARTLAVAIESAGDAIPRWPTQACLLAAAMCSACVRLDPKLDAVIPGARVCRSLISLLAARYPKMARASELAGLAQRYEQLRAELPSGSRRTRLLDDVLEKITTLANPPVVEEARIWFASGSTGAMIVALGLLIADPDPGAFDLMIEIVADPGTPFAQYAALLVIEGMVPRLRVDQPSVLHDVLRSVRSRGELGLETDSSRHRLIDVILEGLERGQPPASQGPGWPRAKR